MTWKRLVEEIFETFLFNSRFITMFAVLGSLASSLAMFMKGTLQIINSIVIFYHEILEFHPGAAHGPDTMVPSLVASVDNYLFATVLLIFSMGLYELFISKIDPTSRQDETRPNWLKISSLDDLKSSLGKVVLMILIVSFFEQSLNTKYENARDLLFLGISTLFVSAALYLTHAGHKNHDDEKEEEEKF
jgi:uncharacterized membrane protein YqhA